MSEPESTNTSAKFLEIELAQSIETFRSLLSLVVSIFSILTAANVALIGYAITVQKALLIGVAAIFPFAGLIILFFIGKLIVPAIYTGLTIENQIKARPDLFFWSFLAVMTKSSIPRLSSIINIKEPMERLQALQRFGGYMPFGSLSAWGLISLSGIQVISVPILVFSFNWSWI